MPKNPTGYELWRGPSRIDGKPIAVVATIKTGNRKTGAMVQTWIVPLGVEPHVAVRTGEDRSVCGDCPRRPIVAKVIRATIDPTWKPCYVTTFQAPLAVQRGVLRGIYPTADPADVGEGREVRLGSWGDPGAVPAKVWRRLTSRAAGHTGYTHLWRSRPSLKPLCMASVDSVEERDEAHRRGWRTFRAPDEAEATSSEVVCPSATVTCAACLLCGGTSRAAKSVVLSAH